MISLWFELYYILKVSLHFSIQTWIDYAQLQLRIKALLKFKVHILDMFWCTEIAAQAWETKYLRDFFLLNYSLQYNYHNFLIISSEQATLWTSSNQCAKRRASEAEMLPGCAALIRSMDPCTVPALSNHLCPQGSHPALLGKAFTSGNPPGGKR